MAEKISLKTKKAASKKPTKSASDLKSSWTQAKFAGKKDSLDSDSSSDKQKKDFQSSVSSIYEFDKLTTKKEDKPAAAGSTPLRFSDRYESKGNSNVVRIIVFIFIIIGLGLAVIYLVENFLTGDSTNPDSASSSSSAQMELIETGVNINYETKPDSEAIDIPATVEFDTVTLNLGSADNATEDMTFNTLGYQAYDSFTRTEFLLSDLGEGFPEAVVEVDGEFVSVEFVGLTMDPNIQAFDQPVELKSGVFTLVELVETADGISFDFTPATDIEDISFTARLNDTADTLVVDFKTPEVVISSSSTSSESSSSSSSVSSSSSSVSSTVSSSSSSVSSVSGNLQLTNSRSQADQAIVNPNPANNIVMENYSFQDFGPKFEFNWEMQGTSDSVVPNTTAEIIQINGVFYVEVQISNLSYDLFFANGIASDDFSQINTEYSNLKRMIFVGRENGVSTYRARLGGLSDYQLTANVNSDSGRRRLTLAVFD